jgi:hypothetical protein
MLDPEADLEVAGTCLSGPAILVGMHRARGYQSGSVSIEAVVDLVLSGLLSEGARASGS